MEKKRYSAPPEMEIDLKKEYEATIHTNKGDIVIQLFSDKAPLTVNNFVFLAREGFYDDVPFHRVIKTFMIQTGDGEFGNGMGGPGYRFRDELPPAKPYKPGIVAMANAGPNTNGSQFFICSGSDSTYLNQHPNYTVFAEVIDGMETVDKIASVPVGASFGGEMSKPLEEVKIINIEVT